MGYRSLVVTGGSMEPTIPLGSMVIVRTVDPRQVEVGDVVSYALPAQPTTLSTHRVARIEPGDPPVIHTKGDANAVEDGEPLDLSRPVGRAWYWVPLAGYLAAFLNQTGGKVVLGIMVGIAWWLNRQNRGPAAVAAANVQLAAPSRANAGGAADVALPRVSAHPGAEPPSAAERRPPVAEG